VDAMDIMSGTPPADDLQATIQQVRIDLTMVGKAPFMRREPYNLILVALADTLSVFGRSITRWERAVADVIAARDPLPEEDRQALRAELAAATENGAYQAMRKEAARMIPTLDRRLSVQIGLAVGGAFVLGAVSVLGVVAVTQHDANAEAARWQSWWNATCADQSPHRVVVAGKPVCQVPIEQAARN